MTQELVRLFRVFMPESVREPLLATLFSGYIGQGPRVEEFERALAPWVGRPSVLTTCSGTAALQLALRLAGATRGRDIVTTPQTCLATTAAIMASGARVVWADIEPTTGNLDPADVRRKMTPATAAIVAVHWGGYPCDMAALNGVAGCYGTPVIQDAAHAFGAMYQGQSVTVASAFAALSFQAIKHLTTCEGGALVCRDEDDYQRGKLLRWYGIDREGPRQDQRCEEDVVEAGLKWHMNDVAATIGLEQLKYVGSILDRHRQNAAAYDEAFRGLPGLRPTERAADRSSSFWLYTLLCEDRPGFVRQMAEAGIEVSRVHARNDTHTATHAFRCALPGVDAFDARQVSIPVGWWLTEQERARVIEAVRRAGA